MITIDAVTYTNEEARALRDVLLGVREELAEELESPRAERLTVLVYNAIGKMLNPLVAHFQKNGRGSR